MRAKDGEIEQTAVWASSPFALDHLALVSAFRAELDRGMAQAHCDVAKSLYDQAVGGNVTAAIWWTKAHMGWSETVIQQKGKRRISL